MCVRLPFNEAKFEFQTIGERTFLESEYSLAGSYSAPKSCTSLYWFRIRCRAGYRFVRVRLENMLSEEENKLSTS